MEKIREIKFRAWDKKNKEMDGVWRLQFVTDNLTCAYLPSLEHRPQVIGKDIELMQYTGLKDKKNGRKVWAGDIISHRNIDKLETDGVVHFDWRGACIIVSGNYVRLDMIPNWKIIGNIYENPELLKENK